MSFTPRLTARKISALIVLFLQVFTAGAGTIHFTRSGLNARSTKAFRGTRNVLTTVPKGTEGEVLGRFLLPSGNYGIKLKITKHGNEQTKLQLGEEIWVYYHRDSESRYVELYDDDGALTENAEAGKWGVALSTFKVAASAPQKETSCVSCNPIVQKVAEPLPSAEKEDLEKIAAHVVDSEKEKQDETATPTPVLNVAIEEIVATIAKVQKEGLAKSQFKKTNDAENRLIAKTLVEKAQEEGVSLALILAMIEKESHFYSKAKSNMGARGLMQIMPITYRGLTGRRDYHRLFEPELNIDLGVSLIAKLLRQYRGDVPKALIVYNFGPGNYAKHLAGTCQASLRVKGVCQLPKETTTYIAKITEFRRSYLAYETVTKTSLTVASND